MKHSQDNLTAASVQQAQSAALQIKQLYATIKQAGLRQATIADLVLGEDRIVDVDPQTELAEICREIRRLQGATK